jgi:hypothetical protein
VVASLLPHPLGHELRKDWTRIPSRRPPQRFRWGGLLGLAASGAPVAVHAELGLAGSPRRPPSRPGPKPYWANSALAKISPCNRCYNAVDEVGANVDRVKVAAGCTVDVLSLGTLYPKASGCRP